MPGVGLRQVVRGVQAVGDGEGAVVVLLQHRLVGRVGAVLDDLLGPLLGGEAAQVGQALLGDQHLHVVLSVVVVGDHRDDRRDRGPLRHRRGDEGRDVGVAGEVGRAADAVHHLRAHDVGGVHVAVDVGLDHAVARDDAEPADHLGVVRDLLRPQDDLRAVVAGLVVHPVRVLGGEREGGRRGDRHLAGVDQVDHAVLDHLGVGGQVVERAFQQAGQHRVGDVADARLQRQQVLRQPALLDLVGQEVEQVVRDHAGGVVHRLEGGVAILGVGLDDGDDLVGVDPEVALADPVAGVGERDGEAVRGERGAIVDVVHALELAALPGVDLEDDLLGLLQVGLVVAHRRGGDQFAVLGDRGHLDHRHVELAEEALPHHRGQVRQVDVGVLRGAVVDLVPHDRVGLVRRPEGNAVHLGQRAVQLGGGGGARPHADGEFLAPVVCLLDAGGQRPRHLLGVPRAGEAREPDVHPVLDQLRGFVGRGDLAPEGSVLNPRHGCSSFALVV